MSRGAKLQPARPRSHTTLINEVTSFCRVQWRTHCYFVLINANDTIICAHYDANDNCVCDLEVFKCKRVKGLLICCWPPQSEGRKSLLANRFFLSYCVHMLFPLLELWPFMHMHTHPTCSHCWNCGHLCTCTPTPLFFYGYSSFWDVHIDSVVADFTCNYMHICIAIMSKKGRKHRTN